MRPEKATRSALSFLCTAVLCALILSGCQPSPNPTNNVGNTGGPHRLAFVPNNASDFWIIARKGTEKAEKEIAGIKVEFRIPADGTAAEQQGNGQRAPRRRAAAPWVSDAGARRPRGMRS